MVRRSEKITRCRILSQSQCVFAIYLKNETMKVNRQFWSHFFSDYLWGGAEKNGAPGHLGTGGSWTELAQGVKCFCRWLFHHSQNQNTQPLSWDGECFRGLFYFPHCFLVASSLGHIFNNGNDSFLLRCDKYQRLAVLAEYARRTISINLFKLSTQFKSLVQKNKNQ